MRTRLRKILSVVAVVMIVVFALASVLVGIYITRGVEGLLSLPGVSAMLGLDHPRDLKMGAVEASDRASLIEKLGGDPSDWPSAAQSTPRRTITVTLTPREGAAFLASGHGTDVFYDVQLAPREPGLLALSGMMKVDGALAVANMDRASLEGMVGALPDEVPVYLELYMAPTDTSLGFAIRQLRIGNVLVPGSALGVLPDMMDTYVRDFFNATFGVGLVSITTDGTHLTLVLEVPES
jgi:hypothetical protein